MDLHAVQVAGEAIIRHPDQGLVKAVLRNAGLVAGNKEYRFPAWIEGESDSPDTITGVEAKFLHIRMLRPFEPVDPRPAQIGSESFEQDRLSKKLVLKC